MFLGLLGKKQTKAKQGDNATSTPRRKTRAASIFAARRAQDFLHYEAMLESGVCILGGGEYSITLRLSDVSYQVATQEVKQRLLEAYAEFLNQFGSGERLTITVASRRVPRDELVGRVLFQEPRYPDHLSAFRMDHNRIVQSMIGDREYAIVAEKFLTITVSAPNLEQAKANLEDLAGLAKKDLLKLHCHAERMNGAERIELMREWTRGCYSRGFDYRAMAESGATTKSELAPQAVERGNQSCVVLAGDEEELHYQVLMVRTFARWLGDDVLARLAKVQTDLVTSLHVQPIEKTEAHELVMKRKAALDMELLSARRRLIKAHMDPDVDLPIRLQRGVEEVRSMLEAMDKEDQRLFTCTLVLMVRASSADELKQRVDQVRKVLRGKACDATILRYWQEQGFNAALPLGGNRLPFHRTLTTAALAVLMPFSSEEILDQTGILYGRNATTGNPIILDRKRKRNGNGFVLGTSGSGKSYTCKAEIEQVVIGYPKDEVIVIDPEQEYRAVGEALGATVIEVHAGSTQTMNPLDIELSTVEGDPIRLKTEAVLGMLQVLLAGPEGLTGAEQSVLDRCLNSIYRRWERNRGAMPTLVDVLEELKQQPDDSAVALVGALELYATGTFSGFARQTNVETDNRFIVYDTSKLGHALRNFGLMVVLDAVWRRVIANYGRGIRTWLYVDEFASMFSDRHAMEQLMSFWTRFRKKGGIPTGILQNITALLEVEEGRRMLNNADLLLLMGQQENDADALVDLLSLSEAQARVLTRAQPGEGLIRLGSTVLELDARRPQDGPLNELFNTAFQDDEDDS
ncbi:VirB4-like conjugal transfer ATPase, CD1110 family [Arachnia propionica]|uniref:DUF87 domain-containing protein n=1 Tax=Arachnia propionica TaxID=1750 RepID=A0A3P1X1C1_9ACTN|nr:DUF87 domain-containing protein [Arachnia propionica]RRD50533.1 DUF87 domain-containing protein [Arachnia propionica]